MSSVDLVLSRICHGCQRYTSRLFRLGRPNEGGTPPVLSLNFAPQTAEQWRDTLDTRNDRTLFVPEKKGEQPPYTTWNQQEIK